MWLYNQNKINKKSKFKIKCKNHLSKNQILIYTQLKNHNKIHLLPKSFTCNLKKDNKAKNSQILFKNLKSLLKKKRYIMMMFRLTFLLDILWKIKIKLQMNQKINRLKKNLNSCMISQNQNGQIKQKQQNISIMMNSRYI